jgi:hypothetical protein
VLKPHSPETGGVKESADDALPDIEKFRWKMLLLDLHELVELFALMQV